MRKSILKLFIVLFSCLTALCLAGCQENVVGMLNPKGIITHEERQLFFDTLALMLIVVLPVIIMSFTFVYHYRASHKLREYKPNWSHSYFLETLWWGIPTIIIVVLAILTFKKTHELDPYNRIAGGTQPPILIQAIALPWKWLFIYPEQGIASVNELFLPAGQQIEFWITADNVPMSAFFIPQLGSQIYAMAGMRTRLHLIANEPGEYIGMNALYNGDGFSDMRFPVHVGDAGTMSQWMNNVKTSTDQLTDMTYTDLLKPSVNMPPKFFASVPANLFDNVIMIYMHTFGATHPRDNQSRFSQSVN